LSRYLELLVLKENKLPSLSKDLLAALTVAVLVIPQGMAYAVLAGFPPIYGLYTCLAPLVLYPIFGTSPYLSIGPVAIISVLLASGLTDIAIPCSEEYIVMGIFVGLVAGVFQVLNRYKSMYIHFGHIQGISRICTYCRYR